MSWDFNAGTQEGSAKQAFTKFPVGITRIRVLDDSPYIRWTHWLPQFQRNVNCPGRGCPIDEIRKQQKANGEQPTYNMSRKFAINIWNYETSQYEILEQGITFFEELRTLMQDLQEDGKVLKDAIIKVRRRGAGKDDTSYRLDIDSIEEMGAPERVVEKKELSEYFQPHTPAQILQLLQVRASTKEEYQEAWKNIMTPAEQGDGEEPGEEIEIR